MKKSYTGLIILIILIILAGGFISIHNNIVRSSEEVDAKYSDIDVQLKRRADLIPNLISTVKGYMAHEEKIIESITEARTNLLNAKTISEKAKADNELTKALSSFNVIVENYPDLKANTNFISLQDELAGTENRIANARKSYNDAVKSYNQLVSVFPSKIVANMFNFEKKQYFEARETDTGVPNVEF